MKLKLLVSVSAFRLFALLLLSAADSSDAAHGEGTFIVTLKEEERAAPTADRCQEVALRQGMEVVHVYDTTLHGCVLKPRSQYGAASVTTAADVAADAHVLTLEEDRVMNVSYSWGLARVNQCHLPLDGSDTPGKVDASGVRVYVLDTGIDKEHSEFGGGMIDPDSSCHADKGTDGTGPFDDQHGHGTHVAGTVCGKDYGVANCTSLCAIKVLNHDGYGYNSWSIAGLDHVVADCVAAYPDLAGRKCVVNMSLGGGYSEAMNSAVRSAVASGAVLVVAAGNDSDDACGYSPAAEPQAITVGSTDIDDQKSSFSNYGTCVDVFAPGSSIPSAAANTGSGSGTRSGTSMASPHVAGIAAGLLGEGGLAAAAVADRLLNDAQLLGARDPDGNQLWLANTVSLTDTVGCGRSQAPTTSPIPCTGSSVTVAVTTDTYPRDTSWDLVDLCSGDGSGESSAGRDDYFAGETGYEDTYCLPSARYRFTIRDAYGDGICCSWGDGSYRVELNGVVTKESDGQFGSEEAHEFGSCTDPPTQAPTSSPTSSSPTSSPSKPPTSHPTSSPSQSPTSSPTSPPTSSPSKFPTVSPTLSPSTSPTGSPTSPPTSSPSKSPTSSPTSPPTSSPSKFPTISPTSSPSTSPTSSPTSPPTSSPSNSPTRSPTSPPTSSPSKFPTVSPTSSPSTSPTSSPTSPPTSSPSNSPTVSPTASPTESPSTSPTVSPTTSPTPAGPWDIDQLDMRVNFANASTIELDYLVGVGREIQGELLSGCVSPVNPSLYSTSNITNTISGNVTHHKLTITYNFDMAELAQSEIWNATSSKLEVCQKLHLVIDGLVIVEDVLKIEVDFDMEANFNATAALAAGTIENATDEVAFKNDVTAYKCNGGSTSPFRDDDGALAPNQELVLCIVSQDENVDIAELTDMSIKQEGPSGEVEVAVVVASVSLVKAITSVSVESDGVIARTRVPIDRFSFETGKNITISGKVELALAGTAGIRKLRALVDEDDVAIQEPEAGYSLTVNLQTKADALSEGQATIDSSDGHGIMVKGFVAIGSAVFVALGLVM